MAKLEIEDEFIGYKLTVDIEVLNIFFDSSNPYWPLGWGARRYKKRMAFQKAATLPKSNMAPQGLRLLDAPSEQDIVNYAKEKGVFILEAKPKESSKIVTGFFMSRRKITKLWSSMNFRSHPAGE